jgi:hypothetical protein
VVYGRFGSGQSTVGQGSSTRLVRSKTRTTRSVEVVYNARPGIRRRRRALGVYGFTVNGRLLKNMETTRGRVIAVAASARSGGRALKQESVPELRSSDDVSLVRTRGC